MNKPAIQAEGGDLAAQSTGPGRRSQSLPIVALTIVVMLWLFPLLFLGRVPLGGDITSQFLPQMKFYGDALREDHRLPIWNEHEGFGGPILAEGQIGVVYPLHLAIYRCFDPLSAYSINIVVHFLLAGWFAYLCARGFGLNGWPALLAAFVFVGQGFFVVHFTRQWSYTSACWLPLAVWAAWRWIQDGGLVCWLLLVAALAMQLLAGHFQVAFYTHVTLLLMAVIWTICGRQRWTVSIVRSVFVLVASLAAGTLAAAQLLPTLELLAHADLRGRGVEFLSSFASSPLHLFNLVAPTLMQQHPLWEPVAWFPWWTSPGECLNYMGLVPLGLGVWTMLTCRRDRLVWLWSSLLVISGLLSLGPYCPGFHWLIECPGFGWFTAPARWTVVSGLFLGLLAGRGLQELNPDRFVVACRWFAGVGSLVIVAAIVVVPASARQSENFTEPPNDYLMLRLIEHGYSQKELRQGKTTPSSELGKMMRGELLWPLLNLALLGGIACIPRRRWKLNRRQWMTLVLVWSAADLGAYAYLMRQVDYYPRQTPLSQSRVLEFVAHEPGQRLVGSAGQFAMMADAAPLSSARLPDMSLYWTTAARRVSQLWPNSLPSVPPLRRWGDRGTQLGRQSLIMFSPDDLEFLRLAGISFIASGPDGAAPHPTARLRRERVLSDPWLSEVIYGRCVRVMKANRWTIWKPEEGQQAARCWFFPVGNADEPGVDPRAIRLPPPARRRMADRAIGVGGIEDSGERIVIRGRSDSPGILMLSDSYYPGWEAWMKTDSERKQTPIGLAFGGWRAIDLPAGSFEVEFRFESKSWQLGRRMSLWAALVWGIALIVAGAGAVCGIGARGDLPAGFDPAR